MCLSERPKKQWKNYDMNAICIRLDVENVRNLTPKFVHFSRLKGSAVPLLRDGMHCSCNRRESSQASTAKFPTYLWLFAAVTTKCSNSLLCSHSLLDRCTKGRHMKNYVCRQVSRDVLSTVTEYIQLISHVDIYTVYTVHNTIISVFCVSLQCSSGLRLHGRYTTFRGCIGLSLESYIGSLTTVRTKRRLWVGTKPKKRICVF